MNTATTHTIPGLQGQVFLVGIDASQFMEHVTNLTVEKIMERLRCYDAATSNRLMSIDEVAKHFGVTKATIHNWVKIGHLEKRKVSGRAYFIEGDVKRIATTLSKYKGYDPSSLK